MCICVHTGKNKICNEPKDLDCIIIIIDKQFGIQALCCFRNEITGVLKIIIFLTTYYNQWEEAMLEIVVLLGHKATTYDPLP